MGVVVVVGGGVVVLDVVGLCVVLLEVVGASVVNVVGASVVDVVRASVVVEGAGVVDDVAKGSAVVVQTHAAAAEVLDVAAAVVPAIIGVD